MILATLIKRSLIKKSFHLKNERLTEILQAVRCHIYDCTNTKHQFIKPFLENEMFIFEEYEAFNSDL